MDDAKNEQNFEVSDRSKAAEIDSLGTQVEILNYVRQNPDGITARLAAEHTGVTINRARDILDELCLRRDIYKRKLEKDRIILYYPNGRLIHKYLQESRDFGDQIFRISFHESRRDPRMQIQERKYTLLEGERVEGSIFVDYKNIVPLMDFLNDMLNKFNGYEAGDKKQ
jgi:hypothetical protein